MGPELAEESRRRRRRRRRAAEVVGADGVMVEKEGGVAAEMRRRQKAAKLRRVTQTEKVRGKVVEAEEEEVLQAPRKAEVASRGRRPNKRKNDKRRVIFNDVKNVYGGSYFC